MEKRGKDGVFLMRIRFIVGKELDNLSVSSYGVKLCQEQEERGRGGDR